MIALVSLCFLSGLVRIEDYSDSIQVIYLVICDALFIHLVPDGVWSLYSLLEFV